MRIAAWLLPLALPLVTAATAAASGAPPPLPDAMVRVVIADVPAFDGVLRGKLRDALEGEMDETDPVAAAWRQSLVGAKLEEQWGYFSGDLALTWKEIHALSPRALGLALLDAGNLEALLVIDTPLAELPLPLPEGAVREHAGQSYHVVRLGAGDGSEDVDRRMGLAWAHRGSLLFVASSVRALELGLEAAGREDEGRLPGGAGRDPAATPGIVEVTLDMERLRGDRYFVREFPFPVDAGDATIRASLRVEGGDLVELRRADRPAGGSATGRRFVLPGAVASGWESDGAELLPTLRGGVLEPVLDLADRPVRAIAPLPPARSESVDPYTVDFVRTQAAGESWEEGDVGTWRELLGQDGAPGSWGWAVGADGGVVVVLPWPEARDRELDLAIRATLERRASRARVESSRGTTTYAIGPGLPAVVVRRTGGHVWLATDAERLAAVSEPAPVDGLERWAELDLDAALEARERIARFEESGDEVKPIADRILGILGWMPSRHRLTVERRQTTRGWEERVVFVGGE